MDLTKLIYVANNEAPAIIGKNKGVVTLLKKHIMNLEDTGTLIKLLSMLHQEVLCARTTNLQSLINITINVVNMSLSNKLTVSSITT